MNALIHREMLSVPDTSGHGDNLRPQMGVVEHSNQIQSVHTRGAEFNQYETHGFLTKKTEPSLHNAPHLII